MLLLPRFPILSALAGLFLPIAMSAQAQTYASGFGDANWSTKSGAFNCSLSQEIPAFGTAYFGKQAGSPGFFEFRHAKKAFPHGVVRLESVPPAWRTDTASQLLFTVRINSALRLNADQIQSVAGALERGNNVLFAGATTGSSALQVVVDSRNFEANYATYKRCLANMINDTFEQLSRTVIYYAADATELSAATRTQLDKIVRYAKADPKVLGILVDAHSDKRETREEAELASQQQAKLVTDYLIEKGLPAAFISAHGHGDKFPIAAENGKSGHAKNRRVSLRLENESTRKDMWRRVAALRAAEEKAATEDAAKVAADAQAATTTNPDPEAITLRQLEQMVEQQIFNPGR
jgi:outer membrane protein OmpA-like peptidoglycan-associated protein